MPSNYKPNRHGIGQYLQYSRELKRELHRRILMGQAAAMPLVPRGKTHELANSSEIRDDGPNGGVHGDRMQYSLHFTARHAVPVTYRKGDNQRGYLEAALAVMRRGR